MIDTSAFQGKKAAFYTLGCKLNFSETSTFANTLHEMGVVTAEKDEKADICLINTIRNAVMPYDTWRANIQALS